MKVNFNPDIELLIREVKMLKILGYKIPSELENVSETGSKFLRQAKSLEQVYTYFIYSICQVHNYEKKQSFYILDCFVS